MIKLILKQIRVSHWIKNLTVFLPLFFAGDIFKFDQIFDTFILFMLFCLSASIVYVFNDLKDSKEDKQHYSKKFRPIASGQIRIHFALLIIFILCILNFILLIVFFNIKFVIFILIYLLLNIIYTFYLKRVVLWDLIIISILYLVRIYAGAFISDIPVSGWLFLTVFFGSGFLISAKRIMEKKVENDRKVLKVYSNELLKNIFIINLTISLSAFSIYCVNQGDKFLPLTVILGFILFRYYYIIENKINIERPEILFIKDIQLFMSLIIFFGYSFLVIYISDIII